MSERIGPINVERGEEHPFLERELIELIQLKRLREDVAWLIDQEIQKLITDDEEKAEEISDQQTNIRFLFQILHGETPQADHLFVYCFFIKCIIPLANT